MKKVKILAIFLCFFSLLSLSACGEKSFSAAQIVRDDARVGGSLSFVYDQKEKKIFVGGQDEVIQFSTEDESQNLSEGCRVGLKVIAPVQVKDLNKATLKMNGVKYSAPQFVETINGQAQNFFNIYPLVSKDAKNVKFSIKWQENAKEQTYKLIIEDGTKFMNKIGGIE